MNRGAVEGDAVAEALLADKRERQREESTSPEQKPSQLKGWENRNPSNKRPFTQERHRKHGKKEQAPVTLLDPVTLKAALWGAADM